MKYGEALKLAKGMYGETAIIEYFSVDGGTTWGARTMYVPGQHPSCFDPRLVWQKVHEVSGSKNTEDALDALDGKMKDKRLAFLMALSRSESDG